MSALTANSIMRLLGMNSTLTSTKLNTLDVTTLGTTEASKVVTADASKNVTGLNNVTLEGLLTLDTGTVAGAGSAQGDAATLSTQVTSVTGADGTVGVKLPTAAAGLVYIVYNTHASNGLLVYPNTSDDINDGTPDAAVTIEGKTMAIFVALDGTTWAAIFTANS